MKVRATQLGYYGHKRRRTKDEFDITDEKHFSKRWMEPVDGEAPAEPVKQEPKKPGRPRKADVI